MTFTLYWRKRTGAFGPAAVLAEAGQTWHGVYVDSAKGENLTPTYLGLNPIGRIPALVLPDGTVMTESAAMMLHLAELFPATGLLPPLGDPARPTVLRWLLFAATNLYETDLRSSYPERYTDDADGAPAVRRAADRRFEELWAVVAEAYGAGPYLLGERYSLVDPYLAMMLAWHQQPAVLIARHPVLGRLHAAVTARPALARLWREYDLHVRF